LVVPVFFQAIEQSSLSMWIRDSPSIFAFYFILLVHTIGLSLVVGASAALDLRILGIAASAPLRPFKTLFVFMWIGLGINIATGILLLIAYPTKALTNPVFYAKLLFIVLAVIATRKISARVFGDTGLDEVTMVARGRTAAIMSLIFWASAITAGRLLSETYRYLNYGAYLTRTKS
jgi:hypothetical protein